MTVSSDHHLSRLGSTTVAENSNENGDSGSRYGDKTLWEKNSNSSVSSLVEQRKSRTPRSKFSIGGQGVFHLMGNGADSR